MNREKIEVGWFGWSKTSTIHNYPKQMSLTIQQLAALVAIIGLAAGVRRLWNYIADLQRHFNDQAAALEAAQTRVKELSVEIVAYDRLCGTCDHGRLERCVQKDPLFRELYEEEWVKGVEEDKVRRGERGEALKREYYEKKEEEWAAWNAMERKAVSHMWGDQVKKGLIDPGLLEAPGYWAKLDRQAKLDQIGDEVRREQEAARSAALVQELNVRVGLSQ